MVESELLAQRFQVASLVPVARHQEADLARVGDEAEGSEQHIEAFVPAEVAEKSQGEDVVVTADSRESLEVDSVPHDHDPVARNAIGRIPLGEVPTR